MWPRSSCIALGPHTTCILATISPRLCPAPFSILLWIQSTLHQCKYGVQCCTLIAHAERNQVGLATYTQPNCTDSSFWPTISFRRPVWNTVRQKRKHGNMAQNHIPVMLLCWPLAAGFDMCFPHRGATVRHLQAHQLPIQDQFNSAMTRTAPSIL